MDAFERVKLSIGDVFSRRRARMRLWFSSLGTVAVGHSAKQLEELIVDHFVYGVVAFLALKYGGPVYGPVWTFLIMTPITAVLCHQYIKFYDWSQRDWLGFEMLKDFRGRIKRAWLRKIFQNSDLLAFLFLSINGDAFMVTVYFRNQENRFGGLTARDKRIFWAALIFSNGFWTLRWFVIMWAIYFWEAIYGAAMVAYQWASEALRALISLPTRG